MEPRQTFRVMPYRNYYGPIELFAQPFNVTDAHTSIQMSLQEMCNKHSVDLHTGVCQLSPGELPNGSWTLACLPGVLSRRSCLIMFAHQDSDCLWYVFFQMLSNLDPGGREGLQADADFFSVFSGTRAWYCPNQPQPLSLVFCIDDVIDTPLLCRSRYRKDRAVELHLGA